VRGGGFFKAVKKDQLSRAFNSDLPRLGPQRLNFDGSGTVQGTGFTGTGMVGSGGDKCVQAVQNLKNQGLTAADISHIFSMGGSSLNDHCSTQAQFEAALMQVFP
jgi:hypothetical protein